MAPTPPSRRRAALEALALGALCATAFLWPAAWVPGGVAGDPLGETDNHLWMLWRATTDLPLPVANLPEGVGLPLMDPVNLLLFWPGALASPAAGWTTLRVGSVLLALAGGYALSRCAAGHRGALVGMVALGCAPFFAGMLDFGITESWPVGLLALHVALLVRHARAGGWGSAALAGLTLGGVALAGWYFAVFGLVVSATVVPALLWRSRRPGLVLQGGLALLLVLPRFLDFLALDDRWSHRWYPPSPRPPPHFAEWRDLTLRGTDLLNLVLPHPEVLHPGKSSYLGLVTLGLAAVGLWRRPRQALPWLAASLPFVVLALGFWPRVAGHSVGIPGPPTLLVELVPALMGLSHWERALAGALPFLAVAAAVGVDAVPRLRRAAPVLALAILVDSLALSGAAWPRTVIAPDTPAGLASLPGRDGVVQLPFDNGRAPFSKEPPRRYNRWQVTLDRPVSENYEGVDALLARSSLVAAAHGRCGQRSTLPPYYQPPPAMRSVDPPTGAALASELSDLRAWGYGWIVLHRDRCPTPARAIQALQEALGPGQALEDGDHAWALPGVDGREPPG